MKNGSTTSLLFFFENAKIWVSRTTLNGGKKEDGLNDYVSILTNLEF